MAKTENTPKRATALETDVIRDEGGKAIGARFAFSDGKSWDVNFSALSPEIVAELAAHGLKAKIQDGAAISRNPANGASATVGEKRAACEEIRDRLLAGEWHKKGGEGGGSAGGLLFRALLVIYPEKKPEDIRAFLERKSAAEKTALRNNPKVAREIEKLKSEKPATGINTDALLEELGG